MGPYLVLKVSSNCWSHCFGGTESAVQMTCVPWCGGGGFHFQSECLFSVQQMAGQPALASFRITHWEIWSHSTLTTWKWKCYEKRCFQSHDNERIASYSWLKRVNYRLAILRTSPHSMSLAIRTGRDMQPMQKIVTDVLPWPPKLHETWTLWRFTSHHQEEKWLQISF